MDAKVTANVATFKRKLELEMPQKAAIFAILRSLEITYGLIYPDVYHWGLRHDYFDGRC